MALSISRAWDETKAAFRRDGRLYATLALAMFVVPMVIAELATPATEAGQMPPFGAWTILTLVGLLIGLVGQLAVCRLALGPPTSVGEAIRHAARRALAYLGAAMVWILPFLVLIGLLGSQLGDDPESAPPAMALGVLVAAIAFLVIAVRFILTSPVASAETVGPIGILSRSWGLTRGHWLRLFGFLVMFLVALMVLLMAVGAVVGTLAALAFGDPEPFSVGTLITSLATQIVGALVTVTLMVMLARIYAQLAGAGETPSVPHAP